MNIVISKRASENIKDIYNIVINLSNDKDVAKKYINDLKTEILKLEKTPYIGTRLYIMDDIETIYRYIRFKKYLIFYRVEKEKIFIDRIHNAREDYIKEFIKEV